MTTQRYSPIGIAAGFAVLHLQMRYFIIKLHVNLYNAVAETNDKFQPYSAAKS